MTGAGAEGDAGTPVRVRGLRVAAGAKVVHEDLDLEVRRGEILGLVSGPGSDKSELLDTLIGLKKPDGGTVEILGGDIGDPQVKAEAERRIGVLFERGALFSFLTVQENVEAPLLEHTRLPMDIITRLAQLKIQLAGLSPESGALRPAELSPGMRKRAAVARAIALDPEILFLDQPTAGLDPIEADGMDKLICGLRDTLGLTVVLITQDLETLHAICDRVAIITDGKVVAVAGIAELERSGHPWVREFLLGPRGRLVREKDR